MPVVYENKCQDSFLKHLLLCPLTVTVCSRWMPVVYENNCHYSFPNIYCYVPWQSQFVLDGCLAFIFINARTLFPPSTAMSLTVAVCSRWMPGVYENKRQDSFPNIYCYVTWQSQFVLDWSLAFVFINTTTLFPTSTALSLDSRSFFSMDAWRLFS